MFQSFNRSLNQNGKTAALVRCHNERRKAVSSSFAACFSVLTSLCVFASSFVRSLVHSIVGRTNFEPMKSFLPSRRWLACLASRACVRACVRAFVFAFAWRVSGGVTRAFAPTCRRRRRRRRRCCLGTEKGARHDKDNHCDGCMQTSVWRGRGWLCKCVQGQI